MRRAARILAITAALSVLALLPSSAGARTVRHAWKVDLGSEQAVKTVTVRWKAHRRHRYRVQVSTDGRSFTTAARVKARRRARVSLRGRSARYIRLAGHGRRPRSIRVVSRRPRHRSAPVSNQAAPAAPAPAVAGWSAPWRAGVLPAPLGPSRGATRFVAPSGSDANPGTEAQPWRSITKALNAAVPGDRVLVRAGTYSGTAGAGPVGGGSVGPMVYGSPQGTAAAPITVEAYPGERPVIAAMVSFPSAQWFRFSGFVIDGAGAPEGAEGVSLGNTSGAAPSHVEISYNEIRNFGRGSSHAQGILHFSGTDTALIGNRIHHIGSQRFYDHGLYLKAGRRVVVANNVISDITGGYGVQIWGDFDDSWVINNTVYASAASGFVIGGNSDRGNPDRVVTANNIFAGHGASGTGEQGYAAKEYKPGGGDSTRHNLGWANARTSPWQLSLAGPQDNRTADPRFANAAARDLRLRSGSPAVNTAESFGLLLDADRRPRGAAPDKGAFEL
jgi:F5/8 type C domain-containing protein/parallel beta helix pectate lyase-like protein/uncharacterized protein DUF1565